MIVGREATGAHFVTDDKIAARRPISRRCVGRCNRLTHFGGQRRRCTFVGIHKENPLGGDAVERGLALRGVVVERALHDQGASHRRARCRVVGAARIPHNDGLDPFAQGGNTRSDVIRLVIGENHSN